MSPRPYHWQSESWVHVRLAESFSSESIKAWTSGTGVGWREGEGRGGGKVEMGVGDGLAGWVDKGSLVGVGGMRLWVKLR